MVYTTYPTYRYRLGYRYRAPTLHGAFPFVRLSEFGRARLMLEFCRAGTVERWSIEYWPD